MLAAAGPRLTPSEFTFVRKEDAVSRETGSRRSLWNWERREAEGGPGGAAGPAGLPPAGRRRGCGELPPLLAGAALLLGYDLRVLWAAPGPPRELSRSLRSLLLQAPVLEPGHLGEAHRMAETGVKAGPAPGPSLTPLTSFLACPIPGQEQLEREAAAYSLTPTQPLGSSAPVRRPRVPGPGLPEDPLVLGGRCAGDASAGGVPLESMLEKPGGIPSGAARWTCSETQAACAPSLPPTPPRQSLLSEMHDARPEAAVC